MLRYRQSQQTIVDARIRLLSEVINHIRSVKLYAYGAHFEKEVNELRKAELGKLRDNGLNRATMTGVSYLLPMLAAIRELDKALRVHAGSIELIIIVSFVTYSLTGHTLDAAIIFSALQYFNILEMPISFLPMILTALSDAMSAVRQLTFLDSFVDMAE
jgi:ABC-type multidrug transport system fused ATPase/permease subunit